MHIDWRALNQDTLRAVIEAFVLREGTDYGPDEFDLDAKVAMVRTRLKSGEAHLVFDAESESIDILSTAQLAEQLSSLE